MVSVIIVNYHVEKLLLACIASLLAGKNKRAYEIIVVDNNESEKFKTQLKRKFPQVIYVKSPGNIGFGAANNLGAKQAKGEYLFFLNPDTVVAPHAIDGLVKFFMLEKQAGMVAPLLLGRTGKPYQQGSLALTPGRGMIVLSFINKLFPHNPISKKYFLQDWDRQSVKEVSVVPGTAFVIKKNLFEKLNGFDERFFLYFEEFDLSNRVRALGWKLFITPAAQVTHAWGESTKQRKDISYIFIASRFAYFKKYFGLFKASLIEAFLQMNKTTVALFGLLAVTIFLATYRLSELMTFIGDQGWYYLSARDMVLSGIIPLVGIASSHPWLHQGAYWTYILAASFKLFGYHPMVGSFSTILLHVGSFIVLYKLALEMFGKRTALIAVLLFATSPLVLFFVRMPYHTSPIVFFTLLFLFFLYRWTRGFIWGFPGMIFLLAVLYNLEIATFPLVGVVASFFLLGFLYKRRWVREVFHPRIILVSFLAYLIPMLPMLLYDSSHGYPQTVKFLAWGGYKFLVLFGYPALTPQTPASSIEMVQYGVQMYSRLILPAQPWIAVGIFVASISFVCYHAFIALMKKNVEDRYLLLAVSLLICLFAFIAVRTPSDAYLPMLLPSLILASAVLFARLLQYPFLKWGIILGLCLLVVSNIGYLLLYEFHPSQQPLSLEKRIFAARYIIEHAEGKLYSLAARGPGSQFSSFTMNYAYLTWYLGHGPSQKQEKLQFIIRDDAKGVHITYD